MSKQADEVPTIQEYFRQRSNEMQRAWVRREQASSTDQRQLDTWDEMRAALEKIAEIDPYGKVSVYMITVLAQAVLKATRAKA